MLGKLEVLLLVLSVFLLFPNDISASSHKRVEINLSNQRLYAYENNNLVYEFVISSGKRRTPTPNGTFYPWVKLQKAKMSGGTKQRRDYYYLPNVPYIIYFSNNQYPGRLGYGIHGTYWHNNFGNPMSHGCVNLRTADAVKLYGWIELPSPNSSGTPIHIYGTTP